MRFHPCTALSSIAALVAVLFLQVPGAQAQNMEWTVIESTGSVLVVQPLMAARTVSLQEAVSGGSTVTTGGDGHAELRRGGQSIAVGPNSRIVLPAAEADGVTKIIQDFGAALFKVDKQQIPHFEVDTPMIAAVVKGTTFTVSAGIADNSVHVVEGLVQVAPRAGGAPVPVAAGVTAVILHNNPGTIDLKQSNSGGSVAPTPPPVSSPVQDASIAIPQPIGAEPLDVKQLTNGLVGSGNASAAAAPTAAVVQSTTSQTEPAATASVAVDNPVSASTAGITAGVERTGPAPNVAAIVQDNSGTAQAAAQSENSGNEASPGSNANADGSTPSNGNSGSATGEGGSVVAASDSEGADGNSNNGNGNSAVTADASQNANSVDANGTVQAQYTKKDGHAQPVNGNAVANGTVHAEDTKKDDKDKDKGNSNGNGNANVVAQDGKKDDHDKDKDKGNGNANVIAAAGSGGDNSGKDPGKADSSNANGNGNAGPIAIAAGSGNSGKDDGGKDKSEKGKAAPRGFIGRP